MTDESAAETRGAARASASEAKPPLQRGTLSVPQKQKLSSFFCCSLIRDHSDHMCRNIITFFRVRLYREILQICSVSIHTDLHSSKKCKDLKADYGCICSFVCICYETTANTMLSELFPADKLLVNTMLHSHCSKLQTAWKSFEFQSQLHLLSKPAYDSSFTTSSSFKLFAFDRFTSGAQKMKKIPTFISTNCISNSKHKKAKRFRE